MALLLVSALSLLLCMVNGQRCTPGTELWSFSSARGEVLAGNVAILDDSSLDDNVIFGVNPQSGNELWTRDGPDAITLDQECLSKGTVIGVDATGDLTAINARFGEVVWTVEVPSVGPDTRVIDVFCVRNADYIVIQFFEESIFRSPVALAAHSRKDGLRLWEDSGRKDGTLSIFVANRRFLVYRLGGRIVTRTATGRVLSTIRGNQRSVFSGGSIYAFSAREIRRVSPTTGDVIWTVPRLDFEGILTAGGVVYATTSGRIVARLRAATGQVIQMNYADGAPQLLANGQLAIISEDDQSLTLLTKMGDIQFTIGPPPLGRPTVELLKNKGKFELYYFAGNAVRRLDLITGLILWEFVSEDLPAGSCSLSPFCASAAISLAQPLEGDNTRVFARYEILSRASIQSRSIGFLALSRESGLLAWDSGIQSVSPAGLELANVLKDVALLSTPFTGGSTSAICAAQIAKS